jgi:hypothetical protein
MTLQITLFYLFWLRLNHKCRFWIFQTRRSQWLNNPTDVDNGGKVIPTYLEWIITMILNTDFDFITLFCFKEAYETASRVDSD